jgi:hypothetical protein
MAVMAVTLVAISRSDPHSISTSLWIAFWVYCLASATQDIAIDGYSIGITKRGEEGPVNAMKDCCFGRDGPIRQNQLSDRLTKTAAQSFNSADNPKRLLSRYRMAIFHLQFNRKHKMVVILNHCYPANRLI